MRMGRTAWIRRLTPEHETVNLNSTDESHAAQVTVHEMMR